MCQAQRPAWGSRAPAVLPAIPGHPARVTEEEGEDDTSGACSAHPASWCGADVVASLPGANLHSPGGQSGGAAFHTLPERLELLSREVPARVTCQFFPWAVCMFIFYFK